MAGMKNASQHFFWRFLGRVCTKAGPMKGQKVRRPRGKTCCWTTELDQIVRSSWRQGGLRTARKAILEYRSPWSIYSIRKRAAALSLCKPKATPCSDADVNSMLWAIDSNAPLVLIAERLGRSVGAVRHKLRALGYTVLSLEVATSLEFRK